MKLEERILRSIRKRSSNIILRVEVANFGSPSQVSRTLRSLQDKGVIMRIGTGIYAKTRTSLVTGKTIPAGSLETLAAEALRKLGVKLTPSSTATSYNLDATTQLPGRFIANTGDRRISRKITVGGVTLSYENNRSRKVK
jgi:hypothetical protein